MQSISRADRGRQNSGCEAAHYWKIPPTVSGHIYRGQKRDWEGGKKKAGERASAAIFARRADNTISFGEGSPNATNNSCETKGIQGRGAKGKESYMVRKSQTVLGLKAAEVYDNMDSFFN